MRILVVSNGYPPRGRFGTEFYTQELVAGLSRRGHELFVLHPVRTGERPRYTLEEEEVDGIPVFLLHNEGDRKRSFAASYRDVEVERVFDRVLERVRPDVVHFLYLVWGLSVGLPAVAEARGISSVLTATDYTLACHRGQMYDHRLERCGGPHPPEVCAGCIREPGPYDLEPLPRLVKRTLARGLAGLGGLGKVPVTRDLEARERAVGEALGTLKFVIAPTGNMAEAYLRLGVPQERIVRLTYAFDEKPFVSVRHEPPPASPRLGFFGQFAPHKGFGTLLQAFERMEAGGPRPGAPPVELVLYGGPSEGRHRLFAEAALARVSSSGVRRGTPFEPAESPRVLAGLTALVLPSEWDENAPLAGLQARAAGVPIVGADVPGIAEIVQPGLHGRLFPPGDVQALAEALFAVIRGEPGRALDPGLPLSYDEHLGRVEELLGSISTRPRLRTEEQ